MADVTCAQAQEGATVPASAGFSFVQAQQWLDPARDVLAWPVYGLGFIWSYMMRNPPAAILMSAAIATTAAMVSIRHQRDIARLRETFTTVNSDNWDEDVIKARLALAKIKKDLGSAPHDIARYSSSEKAEHLDDKITLQTILSDYENIALGIRLNVLDETFLFRWMRSALISDWNTLSPLVGAYRSMSSNGRIYIEFEGLANAWQGNRSYRTGRKIRSAKKFTRIH